RGWAARIHPPVAHTDVATMSQALADAYGEGIASHPADWHMLQRVWRDPGALDRDPGAPGRDPGALGADA
ncbi:MAG: hypothetical protein ACQSGP_14230, partial [Frankia sp.]